MTTETHCVEHAGRARVMVGKGGVCFYVASYFEPVTTKTAQLQTHSCLGSSPESATATWRGH